MLKVDLQQIASNGDTFFSTTDTAYLIFMIIGIIGYFTVPSVANYIVHAGGGNALLQKVTSVVSTSSRSAVQGGASAGASMVKDVYGNTATQIRSGMADAGASGNYFKDKLSGK